MAVIVHDPMTLVRNMQRMIDKLTRRVEALEAKLKEPRVPDEVLFKAPKKVA